MEYEGVSKDKIIILPNGIDVDEYAPKNIKEVYTIRKKLGINENDFVIGTVTHLTPIKGNELLIQALRPICSKHQNVRCLIIGEGPLENKLKKLVARLELTSNVQFLGERGDISELVAVMDLYACPSLSEGMSNSILEAMAMAKPIVATRVGGNPEIVSHRVNGLLIEPGKPAELTSAINDLLENESLRISFGTESRKLACSHYSWDILIQRTTSEYLNLLAKSRRSNINNNW
jgi:glycosyltransferase involved in cell wall biosynthesis